MGNHRSGNDLDKQGSLRCSGRGHPNIARVVKIKVDAMAQWQEGKNTVITEEDYESKNRGKSFIEPDRGLPPDHRPAQGLYMMAQSQATLCDGYWIKRVPSVYTPAQVAEYLRCVGLTQYTEADIVRGGFPTSFDNLGLLVRHHLLAFPFEHTGMHYTSDHAMDVTPAGIFQRLVRERGGSYCFGLNGMFLQILRGLEYRCWIWRKRAHEANPPLRCGRQRGVRHHSHRATSVAIRFPPLVQPWYDGAFSAENPRKSTRECLLAIGGLAR
ncbi:hypothetical protein BD779DRAFT_1789009 [Infundibulicybe gibba]|nr:hypothetical protein BD779DRAFT_1789009 [Infundibulicybe gibba]